MKVLTVYLRMYGSCVEKALKGIGRNLWTVLLPIGLGFVFFFLVAPLVSSLGLVGGILLALALNAIYSCYLYFTGEVVANSKVSLSEFKQSIGVYFWSLMNLFFILWLVNLLLGLALARSPNRALISTGVWLLTVIVLNAAPEIIYQRGTRGGMETIQCCVKFLQEQWIEWFIPNLLFIGAAYLFVRELLPRLPFGVDIVALLFAAALFHVVMVFRGHLFRELDGSSHRQRMFAYRNSMRG